MRALICLLSLSAASCISSAYASDVLIPNPLDGGCFVPGDDGGTAVNITVPGNTQFMVWASAQVNYRTCAAGACKAKTGDAPIAAQAEVDLCMPPYQTTVSIVADGGTPTVCVYKTSPKTVCQLNSP